MNGKVTKKISHITKKRLMIALIVFVLLVVLCLVAVIKHERLSLDEQLMQAVWRKYPYHGGPRAGVPWFEKSVTDLLDQGADINAKDHIGQTPLHIAAKAELPAIAELLLNRGADINAKDQFDRTPLLDALYWGSRKVVRLLIARGADVNARDNKGRTAMMYTGCGPEPEIFKLLIDHGADVNAQAADGMTALMGVGCVKGDALQNDEFEEALRRGQRRRGRPEMARSQAAFAEPVVKMFVENGADVNARDSRGRTALTQAALFGQTWMVKVLARHGADVNAKDARGETALMTAARWRDLWLARVLLANGADVNARNDRGETALSLVHANDPEMVKLLKASGAKE